MCLYLSFFLYLKIYIYIYLYLYLSISIYLYIYIYLSIYLSIYLYICIVNPSPPSLDPIRHIPDLGLSDALDPLCQSMVEDVDVKKRSEMAAAQRTARRAAYFYR